MSLPNLLVVAVALVDAEQRLLLSQRPAHKVMGGMWEFPGGKVEECESPEEAVIREVHEEIGVTLSSRDLVPVTFASHPYDTFHLIMPLYLARSWKGSPQAREGQVLKWISLAEFDFGLLLPADTPLVEKVREMVQRESL